MKTLLLIISCIAISLSVHAGEAKSVELEGTGTCAKCTLKIAESCTNALLVTTQEGEEKTYVFTENMNHGKFFCQGKTEGLVVKGTVKEKDGTLMLTPESVEKKDS